MDQTHALTLTRLSSKKMSSFYFVPVDGEKTKRKGSRKGQAGMTSKTCIILLDYDVHTQSLRVENPTIDL